ncbi:unnamed protein product [Vitrella brassicaformis CCMP3155]|uniref:Amino acid permease/ SLC12A domain-containing protein n=2 Tax=Vitrella brassicaformis TaxID=1169539 RepID=A0A0G4G9A3_VITBC|nr:unnamed protein product [Vitrella brassicaformis CCMP3155]|eukprot:CEM25154.1 unnamed protein product [Vitrella brassicaformis CCMP3155]
MSDSLWHGDADSRGHSDEEQPAHAPMTEPVRKLSLAGLIGLSFFSVSGGVYGSELMVRALGMRLAVLGQLFMCVAYAFPYSLICLEQSLLLPVNGGQMVWARAAYGPFFGMVAGSIYLCYEFSILGSYTALSVDYLSRFFPSIRARWAELTLNLGILLLGLVTCWASIDRVGRLFTLLMVGTLVPSLVLIVWTLCVVPWRAFFALRPFPARFDWFQGVSVLFWSNTGYGSAFIRVADNKQLANVPVAALVNCVIVSLSYLLPFWAAAAVDDDYSSWSDGHFVEVAAKIGAPSAVGLSLALGSLCSALGQLVGDLTTACEFAACMSGFGYLPKCLATRNKSDQPVMALLLMFSLALVSSSLLDFSSLAGLSAVFYSLGVFIKFSCFLYFRRTYPHTPARRWKLPIRSFWGCVAFCTPAMLLSLLPVTLSVGWSSLLAVLLVVGLLMSYPIYQAAYKGVLPSYADKDAALDLPSADSEDETLVARPPVRPDAETATGAASETTERSDSQEMLLISSDDSPSADGCDDDVTMAFDGREMTRVGSRKSGGHSRGLEVSSGGVGNAVVEVELSVCVSSAESSPSEGERLAGDRRDRDALRGPA